MTQITEVSANEPGGANSASAPVPRSAHTTELILERRADGRLWAKLGNAEAAVKVRRCFPWTLPDRYFSLQTADNAEFAFVADPAELTPRSRAALGVALAEAGFVFAISKVHAVREDFELRCFDVETPQGRRTFQTALDTWPRETPDGGVLIEDVAGDVFRIEDPNALDARSRELVFELVD